MSQRRLSWLQPITLALLVAGGTGSTWHEGRGADIRPPERICAVIAPCGEPAPNQASGAVTLPFPANGPHRSPQRETKVDHYRSNDCDDRCAVRRARRDEARRRAIRDYDERMYRDWITADDPRRWQ